MVNEKAQIPVINPLDRRLNAYRSDLADERLKGKVQAQKFTRGEKGRIIAPVADLYNAPPLETKIRAGAASQLLYGAEITVFNCQSGWAWVQAQADSYVGYIKETALVKESGGMIAPTHRVAAPRTFLYCEADLRCAPTTVLSMGSILSIAGETDTRGARYALLPSGEAIIAGHIQPLETCAEDYVSIAENLLNTPYLWGGASAFGIDCSGLVQLSLSMTGQQVPRDSDCQAAALGTVLDISDISALRRGDLIFWRGHVAIMLDESRIIHANGHKMAVSIEPLEQAIERIAENGGGRPIAFRRP